MALHLLTLFLLWNRIDYILGEEVCSSAPVPSGHTLQIKCVGSLVSQVAEYLSNLKKNHVISTDKPVNAILSNPIQLTLDRTIFPYANGNTPIKRQKLMPNWLEGDIKVQQVCIRNSTINAISNDAFKTPQFISLEVFELINVPLRQIYTKSLNGLKNLKFLILRNIQLNVIGDNILRPCTKLEMFTLHICGPKRIWLYNFFGTSTYNRLYRVDIESCNLNGTINDATFWRLKALRELRLHNCNLKKIIPKTFDIAFKILAQLDLDSNQLTTLPRDIFKNAKGNNITINLRDNPWHCDCEMDDLRDFIQGNTSVKFYEIICKSPPNLNGAILTSLPSLCQQSAIENTAENVKNQREIIQNDHQTKKTTSQIKSEVTSIKPLPESTSIFAIKNEQLIINDWNSSKERYIIGFEKELFEAGNEITTKCLTKSNESKKINIEKDLKPNRMYRFCTMKKGSKTIIPSNCVSFVSIIEPKIELINVDALIMMEDKTMSIIKLVINSICVFLISVLGSILIANCFQAMYLPGNGNKA